MCFHHSLEKIGNGLASCLEGCCAKEVDWLLTTGGLETVIWLTDLIVVKATKSGHFLKKAMTFPNGVQAAERFLGLVYFLRMLCT